MIAIVVPTIREKQLDLFYSEWARFKEKYDLFFIAIRDSEQPTVNFNFTVDEIMGEDADLIYDHNDGVRNLGFAFVAKFLPGAEVIISLDDDVLPLGDTIGDHLKALKRRVPVSWLPIGSEYTRGFPYALREEAEVVLSHGVWEGVADWDASTQLIKGNRPIKFYKGTVPKGCLFPFCAMNFAFKRKLLPYIYQAPMFGDLNRFADIWGGIEAKKDIDRNSWAAVTGYAKVRHQRASNVFDNLAKEAKGIKMNEEYGKDEYFKLFKEKRERWAKWIKKVSGKD
jgi:hypothetical protein